jgi:hypothetical protein
LSAVGFARDQIQAPLQIREAKQQSALRDQGTVIDKDLLDATGLRTSIMIVRNGSARARTTTSLRNIPRVTAATRMSLSATRKPPGSKWNKAAIAAAESRNAPKVRTTILTRRLGNDWSTAAPVTGATASPGSASSTSLRPIGTPDCLSANGQPSAATMRGSTQGPYLLQYYDNCRWILVHMS